MSNELDETEGGAGFRNEFGTIEGGFSGVSNGLDGTEGGAGFRNEFCMIGGGFSVV